MRLVLIESADGAAGRLLAARLAAAGLPEAECLSCDFTQDALTEAIAEALRSADMVVVAGGLTPPDGAARAAAAAALGVSLRRSKRAQAHLLRRCEAEGRDAAQFEPCAMLPAGGKAVLGEALLPGCVCAANGRVLLLTGELPDERSLGLLTGLLDAMLHPPETAPAPPTESALPPLPEKAGARRRTSSRKKSAALRLPEPIRRVLARWRATDAAFRRMMLLCVSLMMLATAAIAWVVSLPPKEPAGLIVLSGELGEWDHFPSDEPFELSPSLGVAIDAPAPSGPAPASSVPEPPASNTAPASSVPEPPASSAAPASSVPEPPASSAAPASSVPEPPASSAAPASSVPEPPASSAAPASSVPEPPASSAAPEPSIPELPPEVQLPAPKPSEPAASRPDAHPEAFDELLYYSSGGRATQKNAYELVCGILQNETQGNLASEALKAHAVATYTYLKYNNALGTAPAVALGSPVCENVKKAVSAVLGQTVTCNGALINAVYHSTCGGSTTSAQSVWGGALSYLVSVESPWDKQAPKYAQSYSVSAASLASGVKRTYGISLEGNPSDWILVQRDAPGGYVGTVTLGGRTTALGGTYGSGKTITGRSIREQLFGYQIRSHCFDVAYDAGSESFRFTTYGYGHGVGMSQYGAHYMALDGYDYVQILTHYYTGTTVQ